MSTIIEDANAYGVAVRAGVITPQEADEAHFRQRMNLPAAGSAIGGAWQDDGGVRRPITLVQETAAPIAPPASEDAS